MTTGRDICNFRFGVRMVTAAMGSGLSTGDSTYGTALVTLNQDQVMERRVKQLDPYEHH
jgi:hypothetical protein